MALNNIQQIPGFLLGITVRADAQPSGWNRSEQVLNLSRLCLHQDGLASLLDSLDERDPLQDCLAPGAWHPLDGVNFWHGQKQVQVLECNGAVEMVDTMIHCAHGLNQWW